jgi:hypothetical protein
VSRGGLYTLLNIGFVLVMIGASVITDAANPRVLYVCLLFAACTTPIVLTDRINGRHMLLAAVLGMYFLLFGASDAATIALGTIPSLSVGIISQAELVVLAGAVLLILGYQVAARPAPHSSTAPGKDWSTSTIVTTGIVLWAFGAAATWIWQVYRYRTATEINQGFSEFTTLALVIARLVHPLGMLLLAYALAVTRNRMLLAIVLAAIAIDVMVGFIGDTKELAMRGLLLVIFARVLVDGKLPKLWLSAGMAFVIVAFPVFQAYRSDVMGVRGLSRAQAAEDIGRSIQLALQSRQKVVEGRSEEYRNPSFLGRNNIKPTLEILVTKVGHEVKYQDGYTLGLFFMALVPRMLWPEKPDSSVGQLYNRELHLSDDPDTYISPSFVGDLYWNFGWAGIAVGMPLFGFLLGSVNRRCDLSARRSVRRLLVIATTTYLLCARLEDGIAIEFIVWLRSLLAIALLDLLFARQQVSAEQRTASYEGTAGAAGSLGALGLPGSPGLVQASGLLQASGAREASGAPGPRGLPGPPGPAAAVPRYSNLLR